MNGSGTARLLAAIARAAASLPEVQAAWLFGSRASGNARPDSDVDIGVLLDDSLAPPEPLSRLRRLIEALATEIAADRIDVVILNDAPPALAFQVLKHGKIALERDRVALHRFRVRTYTRHSDFEPTERLFREATRRRALAGSGRG
jgi:predicted nucleotidyltransferase